MALNMHERLVISLYNPHRSGEIWYYTGTDSDGDIQVSTALDDAEHFYTTGGAQNASKTIRKQIGEDTQVEFEKIKIKPRIYHRF